MGRLIDPIVNEEHVPNNSHIGFKVVKGVQFTGAHVERLVFPNYINSQWFEVLNVFSLLFQF